MDAVEDVSLAETSANEWDELAAVCRFDEGHVLA